MHAQVGVVRNVDCIGRVPPGRDFLERDAEVASTARVAFGGFCRAAQIVGGGEVGEHVVVHDCGVLVRPGDTGDVPDAVKVVVPQRYP
jgi:hypothetical protein